MYYRIEHKTGTKEIGPDYPQATCLTQAYAHQIQFDEFLSFQPNLIFELQKRDKLTDVLSQAAISAHGLLISERFKNLLQGFNLMKYKFYSVTIQTKKGNVQYYWIHLISTHLNIIDFSSSSFYYKKGLKNIGEVPIVNAEDYLEKKKQNDILTLLKPLKIKLSPTFDITLDLFSLPVIDTSLYVSPKLRNSIIENKITGIDLNEASNIL